MSESAQSSTPQPFAPAHTGSARQQPQASGPPANGANASVVTSSNDSLSEEFTRLNPTETSMVDIEMVQMRQMDHRLPTSSSFGAGPSSNVVTSSIELQSQLAPEMGKAQTTKYLDKVLRHNLHRFVLALYLLAVGVALVVIVFTNDPDHTLREYYGIHDLISVPLTALIITGLWVKVYICVRHMRSAITIYRNDFARDPTTVFTGMKVSRWKKVLIRIVMFVVIGVKISFLVTMIVCLKKACSRLPGSSVDVTVVVLFSLALAGSVAIVITMIEAAYTIILLMRPPRVLFARRWYPVLIYENATDKKPVLLL